MQYAIQYRCGCLLLLVAACCCQILIFFFLAGSALVEVEAGRILHSSVPKTSKQQPKKEQVTDRKIPLTMPNRQNVKKYENGSSRFPLASPKQKT
jgi:hypothetical protein